MRVRRPTAVLMAALTTVLVLGAIAIVAIAIARDGNGGTTARAAADATPTTSESSDVVPWVDRPAPQYTPSPTPTPTAEYRDCSASDLAAKFGFGGAGAGTFFQQIVFANTGREPCTLDGAAREVVGVRGDGSRRTLARASDAMGTAPGNGSGPANLSPGDKARTSVTTTEACGDGQSGQTDLYQSLVFVLADGSEVTANAPSPVNAICGLGYFAFGVALPQEPASPPDALQASTDLPSELPAGTTVTYTVTLTNSSDHVVSLDPCPSYEQFIGYVSARSENYYYLNCDSVREIQAGQSVRYSMQMSVPSGLDTAKFIWHLQGTDVAVGAMPTITSG